MEEISIGKNILAVDCALRQGSLAVLGGSSILASAGDSSGNPSRAEEILSSIASVLKKAGISLSNLDSIAVSSGPGSYSGIRIGMATAAGLSLALGIPAVGVSLLEALTLKGGSGEMTSAIPVGKQDVAWQSFEMTDEGPIPVSDPVQDSQESFITCLKTFTVPTTVVHSELFARVAKAVPDNVQLVDAGANVARLIGVFAARFPSRRSGRPIYLRNRNFTQAGF